MAMLNQLPQVFEICYGKGPLGLRDDVTAQPVTYLPEI